MTITDELQALTSSPLNDEKRPIRLSWGNGSAANTRQLLIQRIDITEGLCTGIQGHLTCLSSRADLPLKAFIGLPVAVQLVDDRGTLQQICGLVTDARAGQSDGSLATYQLTIRDALAVLEQRINTRVFRNKSASGRM